tara:strand:- start:2317 stop:2889 length:573 start_codon:yes stop_codon:yes gene_type:complete
MILVEEIKSIIYNFIEVKYKEYLKNNNLLLIEENLLLTNITTIYESNIKEIKNSIRNNLKDKYKSEYPSASVENILLDIFQDKELNVNKIYDEIKILQTNNLIKLNVPIINNSLNLNISVIDNYIVINSSNKHTIENYDELYETINQYNFIYSINEKIISDYKSGEEKINIIKNEIYSKNEATIELYYKK